MDPNDMTSLKDIFGIIGNVLEPHHIRIQPGVATFLTRNIGHLFPPRYREPSPDSSDEDAAEQGRVDMDRISFDPASQMAWYAANDGHPIPGLLKANVPLTIATTTYFEIEIVDLGEDGAIGIGLVPHNYPLGNQPGWKHQSIGYHADDGGVFISYGVACKKKEKCYNGNRMGCGIEMVGGQQFVYFTKNGHSVAEQPFDPGVDLFPAIGMNCQRARVRLLDADLWDLAAVARPNDGLAVPWKDQPGDGIDVTVTEQTGHISVFWKNDGFRDVMIPATVPFSQDKAYFEIELFAFDKNGDVSIGFVPKDYPQGRQPGLLPNSIGFHVAKGQFFTGHPLSCRENLEKFTTGDKIGCGFEYKGDTIQLYFNKNGVGFLEEEITVPNAVYPAVGLRSAGKTVSLCVQDFDTWGFDVKGFTKSRVKPKQSAIKCDFDNCTASLKSVPGETTIATLIAKKPVSKDFSYFDFEFLRGESVVIGVVSQDYDVEELPGCHPKSLGYHSDDGGIYEESGRTSLFFDVCSHGDTMGCSVDFSNEQQPIFCFSRNGTTVAEIPFGDHRQKWFPAIGMKSENNSASVLFSDMNMDMWKELPLCAPSPFGIPAATDGATNGAAAPVDGLDVFGQEFKCPICWNVLERPKMFPCPQQHSYCLDCLQNMFAGVAPGSVVQCPVCRAGAPVPRDARHLPDNPALSRLVELYKKIRV